MKRIVPLAFASLAVLSVALARDSRTERTSTRAMPTHVVSSEEQITLDARQEEVLASAWGLERADWTRYHELMRGPLGVYSPNLDPLTALGIEARSDAERQRYAELQARMEGVRVEKLLAYQRAYDAAWKRLYPTLERVTFVRGEARTSLARASASPSHLAVFIKEGCPPCDARVRALQAAGRTFDVFMVGTRGEDATIRAWATRVGVDPKKVRERRITLNHDAGRWLAIGDGGALPAVVHEANGAWHRE